MFCCIIFLCTFPALMLFSSIDIDNPSLIMEFIRDGR